MSCIFLSKLAVLFPLTLLISSSASESKVLNSSLMPSSSSPSWLIPYLDSLSSRSTSNSEIISCFSSSSRLWLSETASILDWYLPLILLNFWSKPFCARVFPSLSSNLLSLSFVLSAVVTDFLCWFSATLALTFSFLSFLAFLTRARL